MAVHGDQTDKRRNFIIEQVRSKGMVSNDEIRDQYNAPSATLKKDGEFFVNHPAIGIKKTSFGFVGERFGQATLITERREESKAEKEAIGRLAALLICAGRGWAQSFDIELQRHIDYCASVRRDGAITNAANERLRELFEKWGRHNSTKKHIDDILESWSKDTSPIQGRNVAKFMREFHRKKTRHVMIDAGTTTEQIAAQLCRVAPYGQCRVTVITNASSIEEHLKEHDVPVTVVGIGGQLRKDTAVRTGRLSELCLDAWKHMSADISFIGATNIRLGASGMPAAFACDSDNEARTKSLMLRGLKCIVMASEKFDKSISSSFVFCPASKEHVDLVITDAKLPEDHSMLRAFEELEIPVLRAPMLPGDLNPWKCTV